MKLYVDSQVRKLIKEALFFYFPNSKLKEDIHKKLYLYNRENNTSYNLYDLSYKFVGEGIKVFILGKYVFDIDYGFLEEFLEEVLED